jgi:hypothetical protein
VEWYGWDAVSSYTHIAGGGPGPYYFNWVLVGWYSTNGGGSWNQIFTYSGPTVYTAGSTVYMPQPNFMFDTYSPAAPGTTVKFKYEINFQAQSAGIDSMTLTMPSRAFQWERYISVQEYQK